MRKGQARKRSASAISSLPDETTSSKHRPAAGAAPYSLATAGCR